MYLVAMHHSDPRDHRVSKNYAYLPARPRSLLTRTLPCRTSFEKASPVDVYEVGCSHWQLAISRAPPRPRTCQYGRDAAGGHRVITSGGVHRDRTLLKGIGSNEPAILSTGAISSTPSKATLGQVNSRTAVEATYMATACLFSASPH